MVWGGRQMLDVCAVRRWCWPCLAPHVEASLKPPALLTHHAPDTQAISWVLEHIWLVSASALGFLPLEALLWDLPITGSFVFFRSQLKLTSDMPFLTAYANSLCYPLPCPSYQPTQCFILFLSYTYHTLKLWSCIDLLLYCSCHLLS